MASTLVAAISTPAGNMAALQTALNAAAPGDTLRLTPGGFYDGTLTLPAKAAAAARITITSDASGTNLPAIGTQVVPGTHAAYLPKLRVLVNNAAAIKTCDPAAGVANGYTLACLEVIANTYGGGSLILLGSNDGTLGVKQDTTALVPGFLTVTQCYIHGQTATGQKRGIDLHGHDVIVRDCYIADCWAVGQDSQAIGGANGTGGYVITNNYLEAAGENFLMGGSDPLIPGLVPSGLTFTRNVCSKPTAWRGTTKAVKNSFELKNFRHAYIAGNRFFYCWTAGQVGYPIVFTPVNQDGSNPATIVADIVFEYNWVAHAPGGVNITSYDAQSTNRLSQRTLNITIRDNLFTDIGTAWGDSLRDILVGNGSSGNPWQGVKGLVVEHNTFVSSSTLNANLYCYGYSSTKGYAALEGCVYRNNLAVHQYYGINGDNTSDGLLTIEKYLLGIVWNQNVLAGGSTARYPAGTYCPTVAAWQAGFVDYAGGNYRLAASSPYRNAGTDGRDIGADLDAIAAAWAGTAVAPPPPPVYTYSVAPLAANLGAAGGTGTLAVTTQAGATWSAVSSAPTWLTVTNGATGTGSGTVTYVVTANTVTATRTGTIAVAGSTVTITQAAAAVIPPTTYTYVVTPTTIAIADAGGSGTIAVDTQAGGAWTAVATDAWITVDSGASGTGSGTVGYTVAANVGALRTGTLTIADTTVTVTQEATPPPPPAITYDVSPHTITTNAEAREATVTITTDPPGAWTAVANDAWLRVDVAAGTGPGVVHLFVDDNAGGARTGTATIAGETVTVVQAALEAPLPPAEPPPVFEPVPPVALAEPMVMLQWSDDGGHTWSDETWVSAGRVGQYGLRAVWRRLGSSRSRVFRVVVSDAIAVVLVDAFVEVT